MKKVDRRIVIPRPAQQGDEDTRQRIKDLATLFH